MTVSEEEFMNRVFISGVVSLIVTLVGSLAYASEYPSRPVRVIAPFPAGGTVDIIARLLGGKLSSTFGQPVVVDNRSGAGGVVGTDIVAKATPDGHTIALVFVSHSINPHVYEKLPYDTERDFVPVALVAVSPNVVVVNPTLPVKSIKDLVALAKAQPGKLNYASSGIGSNSHLSAEMLNSMAGIRMVHIAYKGGPPANGAVAAGEAQVTIPSIPLTMPLITAGRLRAIAVTSTKRSQVLPDVPTVSETLPGYESYAWYGFVAPARTPGAIITRLSSELEKILRMPDVANSLSKQGADPTFMNSAEFGNYIRAELKRWGDVVKAAGLKPGSL
jgi:tripartite-type tricarboxylate transporter receptor subunit TctC